MNKSATWTPDSMVTLTIKRVASKLQKLNDQALKPLGLTTAQLPVLVVLKNGESRSQNELAQITGVEQPSMAQLLRRMEADGLIERRPNARDRRSSEIVLTPHAMSLLAPGRDALRQVEAAACAGLDKDEKAALSAMLQQIMTNLKSAAEPNST